MLGQQFYHESIRKVIVAFVFGSMISAETNNPPSVGFRRTSDPLVTWCALAHLAGKLIISVAAPC